MAGCLVWLGGVGWRPYPSLEIDRGRGELECCRIAHQSAIAGTRKAIDALEQCEQWLDRRASMRDDCVTTHRPRSQAKPAVVSAHNAVANIHLFQPRAARNAIVGFVGIDRCFIAA